MSNNHFRQQLIAAGLWDINDLRDPSLTPAACDDLELRCQAEFPQAKNWIISYIGIKNDPLPYRIYLSDRTEIFALEATRSRVICQAALRLTHLHEKEATHAFVAGKD